MRVAFALLVLLVTGCISDPTIVCGTQRCSASQVCTPGGCASPEAAAACAGLDEATTCSTEPLGVCVGGACRPTVCGDARIDPSEACDDGNTAAADGCSALCDSTEVCGNGVIDLVRGEECDSGPPRLSGDGCSSHCRLELASWVDVTPQPLGGRAGVGLAFDIAHDKLVLFGGFTATALLGDTWTRSFDGVWTRRDPALSPPARSDMSIAYDPVHQRVVLFGGTGATGALDDTWLWDGATWSRATPAVSPPARSAAPMVWDPVRERIVVIAGYDAFRRHDVWEWDGTTWAQAADGPDVAYHAATWDAARGAILFYGDHQTWTRTDGLWTQLSPETTPTPKGLGALAFHPSTSSVVLFGGIDDSSAYLATTWMWNGTNWALAQPDPMPGPRSATALALDPSSGHLVLVGGYFYGREVEVLADTHEWDGSDWTRIDDLSKLSPEARWYAAMVAVPSRGELVVFAGLSGYDNREWTWRDGQWFQSQARVLSPDGRFGTGMVYDEERDVVVLFGGGTSSGPVADTWLLSGAAWTQQTPAVSPPARDLHAMAYDTQRKRVVLFGGYGATGVRDDLWQWDGSTWSQLSPPLSPSPRAYTPMAYDPIRDRVVLFGGCGDDTYADTWELDGDTWHLIPTSTSPGPRCDHALAYDPNRQRIVLFGGTNNTFADFGDTWEWDGTTWTEVGVVASPTVRHAAAMAYEPSRRRMILFGGYGLTDSLGDTWALVYETPLSPGERCKVATNDDDGDGAAGCDDPDCWGRCTPLCPPATSCNSASPRCGDGACSPVEDVLICPADCS